MSVSSLACLAGGPVQIAYGVDDLGAAVVEWEAKGAGPFIVREHIEVEPSWFDHSSAYGWWGSVMVELVHVHAPASLAQLGLHHMAFFVDSFADATDELTAAGFDAVLTAKAGSTDFSFHDARETLGHLIEIYEGSEGLRGFYASVEAAHVNR